MPDSSPLTIRSNGMQIEIEKSALEEIVKTVSRQVLHEIADNSRLAFDEIEAAKLIGVPRHTLRDCRLRGEITASKIGKKWFYSRRRLIEFLEREPEKN